jgi:hypothetical protein
MYFFLLSPVCVLRCVGSPDCGGGGVLEYSYCVMYFFFLSPVCVLRCVGSPDCGGGGVRVLGLLRLGPCGPCKHYIATLLG